MHINYKKFILYLLLSTTFLSGVIVHAQTAKEARQMANTALSKGDFESAIEYLQLLIEYLGESKKQTTVRLMEAIYYKLGVAFFFTGNFDEAEKAFKVYRKKYPKGVHGPEAELYIADSLRFRGKIDKAFKAYRDALKAHQHRYSNDRKTDIYCAMIRCKIAKDKWDEIIPLVKKVFEFAPDSTRKNWAATIGTIAYLKEMEIEKVFNMMPTLLKRNSFASRSVALNMAALEAGDSLFAEEMYREALWLYRLVYSHDMLSINASRFLTKLERRTERLKNRPDALRALMRLQERIGETEAEIKALDSIDNYDIELYTRMAKSYMEISRFREARELYLYLHGETEGELADESLYLAFRCSLNLRPLDKAFTIGTTYMEEYPSGEYFDTLTLAMGQVYALLQDWPMVIKHFKKTLEIKPEHEDSAECEFLIAYASFMEEKYKQTIHWLTQMNKTHPDNPRVMDSLYWLGMAKMFDKDYKGSSAEFDDLLDRYPGSQYTEDAKFRRAVCAFGLSKMEDSEKRLNEFVATYPDSKLTGEAYMMLGDIAASFAELNKAVRMFQEVPKHEINIELYNYAMFRCGEILFKNELKYDKNRKKLVIDYDAVIRHFNNYIATNRPDSNIPQAVFYIGRSLWNKGEKSGALESYVDAINEYGNDVNAVGVDMILEEWVGKANSLKDQGLKERTWQSMKTAVNNAEKNKKKVLALRLKRALLYQNNTSKEEIKKVSKEIALSKNIPFAGPSTLEFIMDEAIKQKNNELAIEAADAIIETFTETDYALSARMFLAKEAIKNKDYKTALKHLGVIKEVFASDIQAAESLAIMGDLYLKQKDYKKADECFKAILAVREWKGKLWPRALYGRAESAAGMRKYDQACAYYERIYLMYSFYKHWGAKAYLQRSKSLAKLREYKKAAETLQEMFKDDEYSKFPEWNEAKKEIKKLERRI
jgi:TolA-binding protein